MKRALWMTLLLALAVSACDKKKEEKPAAKKATVERLSDAELDKAQVPVKEEFEVKARTSIDEKNVESQLDALEKEINADK